MGCIEFAQRILIVLERLRRPGLVEAEALCSGCAIFIFGVGILLFRKLTCTEYQYKLVL